MVLEYSSIYSGSWIPKLGLLITEKGNVSGPIGVAKEDLATAIFPQSMASLCDGICIQELDEPDLITKILLIWAKGKKPVPLVQEFLDVCGEH